MPSVQLGLNFECSSPRLASRCLSLLAHALYPIMHYRTPLSSVPSLRSSWSTPLRSRSSKSDRSIGEVCLSLFIAPWSTAHGLPHLDPHLPSLPLYRCVPWTLDYAWCVPMHASNDLACLVCGVHGCVCSDAWELACLWPHLCVQCVMCLCSLVCVVLADVCALASHLSL